MGRRKYPDMKCTFRENGVIIAEVSQEVGRQIALKWLKHIMNKKKEEEQMSNFLIINIEDAPEFTVVGTATTLEEAEQFVKNDEQFFGEKGFNKIYQEVK